MDMFIGPLALFIVFTGCTYMVLQPFLHVPAVLDIEDLEGRFTALEVRKLDLYGQIREAEFEREMGTIDDEDFERTKRDLFQETAEVLDALEKSPKAPQKSSGTECPSCRGEIVKGARFCTHCGEKLGASCPSCNAAIIAGDKFCTNCGHGLRK